MSGRPRIAWWSPLPPDPSGVADYAEELLPHLARSWEIDLFCDGPVEGALARAHRLREAGGSDAAACLGEYDAVLYHIGNNPSHVSAYRALLRHPGFVVLHDLSLVHLVHALTAGNGRRDRFLAELRAQHGDDAAEAARRHYYLGEPAPWDVEPLRWPLNRRVLARARAVLVHSRFAAAHLRALAPGLAVEVVEHHALPPPRPLPAASSGGEEVVFCTAGFLTPAKRVDTVLRALARLRGRLPFRYRLVGAVAPGYPLFGMIRDLGLREHVELVGRVEKADLYRLLAEADVCINLRYPTSGETSGIVQRALASGQPLVVNDVGAFAGLPDDCVVKVAPGAGEVEALADVLEALARDPARRAAMGRAALVHAAQLDPASRARAYERFVRVHAARPAPGEAAAGLACELADAARELGVEPDLDLDALASDLVAPGP